MGIPQGLEWFDSDEKKPDEGRRLILFSRDEFSIGWFEDDLFFYANNPTEYVKNPDAKFWSYLPKPRSFTILEKADKVDNS